VYNTLLPFSAGQSDALADYNNRLSNNVINQSEYYYYRNQLLSEVEATDQRASWFNGATDYSYQATGENYFGNSDYLFFEDNAGRAINTILTTLTTEKLPKTTTIPTRSNPTPLPSTVSSLKCRVIWILCSEKPAA